MSTTNPTANFFNRLPESRGYRPRDATSRHAPPCVEPSVSKIGSTQIRIGRAIERPHARSRSAKGYTCGGGSGRGSVAPTAHRGYGPEVARARISYGEGHCGTLLGKEDPMLRRALGPVVLLALLAAGALAVS